MAGTPWSGHGAITVVGWGGHGGQSQLWFQQHRSHKQLREKVSVSSFIGGKKGTFFKNLHRDKTNIGTNVEKIFIIEIKNMIFLKLSEGRKCDTLRWRQWLMVRCSCLHRWMSPLPADQTSKRKENKNSLRAFMLSSTLFHCGGADLVACWLVGLFSKAQADERQRNRGQQGNRVEEGDGMQQPCHEEIKRGLHTWLNDVYTPQQERRRSEDVPNRSTEKKSSQNMQRTGATITWLMAALWMRWLSLVGTYA